VDVYVIHYRDGKTPIEDVVGKLEDLKQQGKIRCFGLSNYHGDEMKELLPFKGKFVCCQDEYSLASRKNEQDLLTLSDEIGVSPLTWGSLGQGISAAAGMALAFKHQGKPNRVYTLLGDGEIEEGEVWEALMFSAHYKLDNLVVVIDNNNLQIDGPVDKVMSVYPIVDKLKAFGLEVCEINGNDLYEIEAAMNKAKEVKGKPFAIVMKTTKGKGVSFMENQAGWHGKAPNDAECEKALAELAEQLKELEAEA
jgi:deoxyxylulose-5-phosphate synthase